MKAAKLVLECQRVMISTAPTCSQFRKKVTSWYTGEETYITAYRYQTGGTDYLGDKITILQYQVRVSTIYPTFIQKFVAARCEPFEGLHPKDPKRNGCINPLNTASFLFDGQQIGSSQEPRILVFHPKSFETVKSHMIDIFEDRFLLCK